MESMVSDLLPFTVTRGFNPPHPHLQHCLVKQPCPTLTLRTPGRGKDTLKVAGASKAAAHSEGCRVRLGQDTPCVELA